MFAGENLDCWIEKVEMFFRFMRCGEETKLDLVSFCLEGEALKWFRRVISKRRFKDWKGLKQNLRDQFKQVTNCSSMAVYLTDELISNNVAAHEKEEVQREHSSRSTITLNMKNKSFLSTQEVHETVVLPKTVSPNGEPISGKCVDCPVLSCFVPDIVSSSVIDHVTSCSSELMLQKESVHAFHQEPIVKPVISMVGSTTLELTDSSHDRAASLLTTDFDVQPHKNEISCFMDNFEASQHCETEMMRVVQETKSPMMGKTTEKSDVDGPSLMHTCYVSDLLSFVEDNTTTPEDVNVIAAEESEKISQYWSDILKPAIMDESYEQSGNKTEDKWKMSQHWVGFTKGPGEHNLLKSKLHERCKQERKKMSLASKSWMFKFKQKKQLMDAELICFSTWLKMELVSVYLAAIVLQVLSTSHASITTASHLWHRWKNKARTQTFTNTTYMDSLMLMDRDMYLLQTFSSPHHVLKHSEVIWQWVCFGLQPHRSSQQSSSLFLLNTSLWASLFSRGKVYRRLLTYWVRLEVLIWLHLTLGETDFLNEDESKQWENEVVSTQRLFHVLIHLVLKGRRVMVLMCVKRHLLHRLIHHKQIWKKYYKARRFKYKERTGRLCYYMPDGVLEAVLVFLGRDGELSSLDLLHQVVLTKLEGKLVFKEGVLIDMVYHMLLTS